MIIITKKTQTAFFLQLFKKETGLFPTEHNILSAIHRTNIKQPFASMEDIMRETGCDRNHLSKFMSHLKSQGYLFCKKHNEDKRKRLYSLTECGRKKVEVTDYQLTMIEKTY